jgi:hypothetical protein
MQFPPAAPAGKDSGAITKPLPGAVNLNDTQAKPEIGPYAPKK